VADAGGISKEAQAAPDHQDGADVDVEAVRFGLVNTKGSGGL
jgi:hypothetical protein